METYHYLAITISILSFIVSIYTYKKTYELNLDTRNLNYRKALSEQFDEYSTLLHSEYWKLKDDLSNLSSALCDTNASIGNILDKYDSRNKRHLRQHVRHLRHLYVDLHDEITDRFKPELPYQTSENIYQRLAMFKHLDPDSDFRKRKKKRRNIFSWKGYNKSYQEHKLKESEKFINSFIELTGSIDKSDSINIYNEFVDACKELKDMLVIIKIKCNASYNVLESGTLKNNLQEFKLWENSPLYFRYRQYKCLMKLIDQSRIYTLNSVEEPPYLTVSEIVYYGANINMINELLCETSFSFRE
ncbi:hypothetical protein MNBD_GAMMA08-66 [hydrothermal vent metagenome]|uniref:Uncharacterized protein n=1 Tax=hydrothermal vent metagenome TaxID=652676 RepID=A0A3B0WQK2_9ZZZZ